jgi:hypothetical protein
MDRPAHLGLKGREILEIGQVGAPAPPHPAGISARQGIEPLGLELAPADPTKPCFIGTLTYFRDMVLQLVFRAKGIVLILWDFNKTLAISVTYLASRRRRAEPLRSAPESPQQVRISHRTLVPGARNFCESWRVIHIGDPCFPSALGDFPSGYNFIHEQVVRPPGEELERCPEAMCHCMWMGQMPHSMSHP